ADGAVRPGGAGTHRRRTGRTGGPESVRRIPTPGATAGGEHCDHQARRPENLLRTGGRQGEKNRHRPARHLLPGNLNPSGQPRTPQEALPWRQLSSSAPASAAFPRPTNCAVKLAGATRLFWYPTPRTSTLYPPTPGLPWTGARAGTSACPWRR